MKVLLPYPLPTGPFVKLGDLPPGTVILWAGFEPRLITGPGEGLITRLADGYTEQVATADLVIPLPGAFVSTP